MWFLDELYVPQKQTLDTVDRCTRHCRGLLDSGHQAVQSDAAVINAPGLEGLHPATVGGRDEAHSDGYSLPPGHVPYLRLSTKKRDPECLCSGSDMGAE